MNKASIFLLMAVLATVGCRGSDLGVRHGPALQPGDLLFQDLDCGPLCDAIEQVTPGYDGRHFSHVGLLVKSDAGKFVVIEAVSQGVQATPLPVFLSRSVDARGQPKTVVGRLREPCRHLIPAALDEASALEGKPYDPLFAADNDAYCCSELVYEAFRKANGGEPLFALAPMTFKDPTTGQTLQAWQDYFSKLDAPVPEGEPGINPGSIACSPLVSIVYRYDTAGRLP